MKLRFTRFMGGPWDGQYVNTGDHDVWLVWDGAMDHRYTRRFLTISGHRIEIMAVESISGPMLLAHVTDHALEDFAKRGGRPGGEK